MEPMVGPEALALFRRGVAAGGRLDRTERPEDGIALQELVRLGLAQPEDTGWRLVPPRTGLAPRVADLAAQRDQVLDLADQLAGVWDEFNTSPHVDVLIGASARAAYVDLVTGARVSVDASNIRPGAGSVKRVQIPQPTERPQALVRSLYDTAVMSDPAGLLSVRESMAEGEVARVLPRVPFTFMVADREVAAIFPPYTDFETRQLLLTRHVGLVQTMSAIFELLWDFSIELRPSAWSGPVRAEKAAVEKEDEILLLMAAGISDSGIAREVGMSERTLARRIADLQLRLGAKNRYQLGYQAALRLGKAIPESE